MDPAFGAERKDLITGLTDVRKGDLQGVYANSTDVYDRDLALARKGHKMILMIQALISPDFFQCVGTY